MWPRWWAVNSRTVRWCRGWAVQRVALAASSTSRRLLLDEPLRDLDARAPAARRSLAGASSSRPGSLRGLRHPRPGGGGGLATACASCATQLLQMASPDEIYNRPADLFVASLAGAAVEPLAGLVLERNGRFGIEAGGQRLRGPAVAPECKGRRSGQDRGATGECAAWSAADIALPLASPGSVIKARRPFMSNRITRGRERLQLRRRCALALELPQRYQRLGPHARVIILSSCGAGSSGLSIPGCRGPRRPRCQAARLRTKASPLPDSAIRADGASSIRLRHPRQGRGRPDADERNRVLQGLGEAGTASAPRGPISASACAARRRWSGSLLLSACTQSGSEVPR